MNVEEIDSSTISDSGTSAAGNPSPYRREFDAFFDIKEPKTQSFDEHGFLSKLKAQIEQEAQNSGVSISGGGAGNDMFHINYQNEKHQGGIEVLGVRTAPNKYRVFCVIRELAAV